MSSISRTMVCAAALLFASVAAAAAAMSDWQDLGGGKARLLATLDPATNEVSGVVEIALDAGWKTYWREPGSSGIPPMFDFSGSRDFVAGEVAFPVPEHVVLPDSDFVGYHGRVLFPFRGAIVSNDPAGTIRMALLAGVCKEVCIPATAEFELPFAALMVSDLDAEDAVAEAALSLPGEPSADFAVESVTIEGKALEIVARLPGAGEKTGLFVEGPPQWRLLPAADNSGGDAARQRFRVDLSGIPADAEPAQTELRFTLVQDGAGVEQWLVPKQ